MARQLDSETRSTPETISVGVEQVPGITGFTRTQVFELIRSGDLKSFKLGRRRIVPIEAILECQQRLMDL